LHQNFENFVSPPFLGFQRQKKAQNVRLILIFHLVLTETRLNIYRVSKTQKEKQSNFELTFYQFWSRLLGSLWM